MISHQIILGLKKASEISCTDYQIARFVWNDVSENRVISGNLTRNTIKPERPKKWLTIYTPYGVT